MSRGSANEGMDFGVSTPKPSRTRRECPETWSVTTDLGIAIIDKGFRFQAINRAMASMNGFSIEAHIGRTVREILGPVAEKMEPRLRRAFESGENVVCELAGQLPTRSRMGQWVSTLIPVRNSAERVERVCAIVFEVTERMVLGESLFGLTDKLNYLNARLRRTLGGSVKRSHTRDDDTVQLLQSVELVERCTADLLETLELMRPSARSEAKKTINEQTPATFLESSNEESPHTGTELLQFITQREREVMRLLASNGSNKEVAFALGISVRTVEFHRRRIMQKLGLHSMSELVHLAIRNGIVEA